MLPEAKYKKLGWFKYQLTMPMVIKTSIRVKKAIHTKFISLNRNGLLVIMKGYIWNG